jgi:hypothetical protein
VGEVSPAQGETPGILGITTGRQVVLGEPLHACLGEQVALAVLSIEEPGWYRTGRSSGPDDRVPATWTQMFGGSRRLTFSKKK